MALGSDIASATSLEAAIAALSRVPGAIDQVAEKAVPRIVDVIDRQFSSETDPDGHRWADGPNYNGLIDTGAMLGSLSVTTNGGELVMTMDSPFEYHQNGTSRMPRRQILPEGELPDAYRAAIEAAVFEVFER